MSRQYICSTCAGDPRWTTEFYRATGQGTGALVIEKRLRPGHPFGRSLPERERRITLHLAKQGLPVARLCPPDYYDAWSVISEFVGPNLRWLTLHDQTGATDTAAMWHAAILATAKMAKANVMVTDWAARNVAYPLTGGLGGRVQFSDPRLLDHAFTQSGADGAEAQKGNIWMRADQDILAPELRRILLEEQAEALLQVKAMTGGAVTALADLAGRPDCEELYGRIHLGRVSLQARLRDGSLDQDLAMQHAIGHEALTLLAMHGARRAGHGGVGWLRKQQDVFRKMSAQLPADRFDSLTDAAHGLASGMRELPSESSFSLPVLNLEALIRRPNEATRPLEVAPFGEADDAGTLAVADGAAKQCVGPVPTTHTPVRPKHRAPSVRRAAALMLGFGAVVVLSVPAPETVDTVAVEVARQAVIRAAARVDEAAERAPASEALRRLVAAVRDPRQPVRDEAAIQLERLWQRTQTALFRALRSPRHGSDADLERLTARVRAFADAGYAPAGAIKRLLDSAAGCGDTGACLRQTVSRLQAVSSGRAPGSG